VRYYLDFEKQLEPIERRIEEIRKFHDTSDPHYAGKTALERDSRNWKRRFTGA
jgi:hypothetical protein